MLAGRGAFAHLHLRLGQATGPPGIELHAITPGFDVYYAGSELRSTGRILRSVIAGGWFGAKARCLGTLRRAHLTEVASSPTDGTEGRCRARQATTISGAQAQQARALIAAGNNNGSPTLSAVGSHRSCPCHCKRLDIRPGGGEFRCEPILR